jgi:uncharacterized protein (DUF2249 family)
MVIQKSDSVATVLRHDESLIDVFIGLSPAFERLRNPAMRKVMARLVTVEQAARMAGVDDDELVRRLNRVVQACAPAGSVQEGAKAESVGGDLAAALRALPAEQVIEIDVREDLRAGNEPFSRIMAARQRVPDGGILSLRATFEPVPLYAVMAKQGFDHYTEQLGDEDWRVWFYPAGDRPTVHETSAQSKRREIVADGDWDVVVLDVRNLEPPEPMVRTLAALEELPPGATLVQLNHRVPQFLLPQLQERGFTYDVREQDADLVRVFIRRAEAG